MMKIIFSLLLVASSYVEAKEIFMKCEVVVKTKTSIQNDVASLTINYQPDERIYILGGTMKSKTNIPIITSNKPFVTWDKVIDRSDANQFMFEASVVSSDNKSSSSKFNMNKITGDMVWLLNERGSVSEVTGRCKTVDKLF